MVKERGRRGERSVVKEGKGEECGEGGERRGVGEQCGEGGERRGVW